MGKTKIKAGGKAQYVKVSFEKGRTSKGGLTQTEVFLISSLLEKEKKIKPDRTVNHKRTNRGREDYSLRLGGKYRIITKKVNKGKASCSSAILVIERNGKIGIEEWQGNFPPQFSLI